jgi:enterochelin esterase-like enzyme
VKTGWKTYANEFAPTGGYPESSTVGRILCPHSSNLMLLLMCIISPFIIWVSTARAAHFYNEQFGRPTNVCSSAFYSRMLGREIRYCIYLPPSYYLEPARRFPVIYYFHGFDIRGVAYQDWLNWHLDEVLDALIAGGRIQEMIVVMPECFSTGIVVNWGRYPTPKMPPPLTFPFRLLRGAFRSAADPTYLGTYLFIHRWDLDRADYADFFTSEFFREIEENYRVMSDKRFRALCGFSTGGYSALSVAFQNPDLFDSVSAHAPMLVAGSPFSLDAGKLFEEYDPEKDEFIPQRFTINLLRRIFANDETWQANNPILLAECQELKGLSIYMDVAERDKRQYDVGARELAEVLQERGMKVRFEVVQGLSPMFNHTYPGFLNGKLISEYAEGKTDEELYARYGWKNLRSLLNPDAQQIEHSLMFHSREFSEE